MERPYLTTQVPQFETLVREHQHDNEQLKVILAELERRRTRWAGEVKQRVLSLIAANDARAAARGPRQRKLPLD
jgi:hypothetical protein